MGSLCAEMLVIMKVHRVYTSSPDLILELRLNKREFGERAWREVQVDTLKQSVLDQTGVVAKHQVWILVPGEDLQSPLVQTMDGSEHLSELGDGGARRLIPFLSGSSATLKLVFRVICFRSVDPPGSVETRSLGAESVQASLQSSQEDTETLYYASDPEAAEFQYPSPRSALSVHSVRSVVSVSSAVSDNASSAEPSVSTLSEPSAASR